MLADLAAAIPDDRRDLPLLVSVGRLNPVKGMDRIVAAWANDPLLHAGCTLVIVGGDLAAPSVVERSVLAAIERLVPVDDERRSGLVLLGGRPHADVARLLVAAARGRAGGWPAGGVYVDGAWKEEFGLAVLEALAAGLVSWPRAPGVRRPTSTTATPACSSIPMPISLRPSGGPSRSSTGPGRADVRPPDGRAAKYSITTMAEGTSPTSTGRR